jgi:GNAT superfamily N-acetyltransferase
LGAAISETISLTPRLSLRPMTPELAELLGPAVAAIEPWSTINYPAAQLTAFLTLEDPALNRRAIFVEDEPAGIIAVRSPWLRGPYLQVLALLRPFQGQGFGKHLLAWFETQATGNARWLWLCHSSFNRRAGAFYTREGFHEVAVLTDLMLDGGDEVLMRKRIEMPAG